MKSKLVSVAARAQSGFEENGIGRQLHKGRTIEQSWKEAAQSNVCVRQTRCSQATRKGTTWTKTVVQLEWRKKQKKIKIPQQGLLTPAAITFTDRGNSSGKRIRRSTHICLVLSPILIRFTRPVPAKTPLLPRIAETCSNKSRGQEN